MNTILKKVITAVITLMMVAGCASSDFNREVSQEDFRNGTPTLVGNGVMQAGTICNRNPAGGSVIVTSSAVNPKGVSAAVQSEISNWVGNDRCEYLYDTTGNRIPAGRIGQAYTQNVDIMDKVITGSIGVVQSAANGYLAATAIDGCSGGNCGAPNIIQVSSQSGSQAGAEVEITEAGCGPACMAPGD